MSDTAQGGATPETDESWDSSRFYYECERLKGNHFTGYKSWHATLQQKFVLHPSVKLMLSNYRPVNHVQLCLEWPHVSVKEPGRVAFTRNDSDGEADRRINTSLGKYLAKHWPNVPDHKRRDIQALFVPDTFKIVDGTPEIIRGVENGPRSCMASAYRSIPWTLEDKDRMNAWFEDNNNPEPNWDLHPYACYKQKFGWRMALRVNADGRIDGRALLHEEGDRKVFVRTYRRHLTDPDGWSETDFSLQTWLEVNGYTKLGAWPYGVRLDCSHSVRTSGNCIRAPYIDGDRRGVECVDFEKKIYAICPQSDADYWCESTQGFVPPYTSDDDDDDDDDDNYRYCDDCEDRVHYDEITWVERHEERGVCSSCLDNYIYAVGRGNRGGRIEYYAHENHTLQMHDGSFYVDIDSLPDDIVILGDGDPACLDDCVSIDTQWYLTDDYRVCEFMESHNGQIYGLRTDSYQDTNGDWWYDEDHYFEFNPPDEDDDDDEEDDDETSPAVEPLTQIEEEELV